MAEQDPATSNCQLSNVDQIRSQSSGTALAKLHLLAVVFDLVVAVSAPEHFTTAGRHQLAAPLVVVAAVLHAALVPAKSSTNGVVDDKFAAQLLLSEGCETRQHAVLMYW
jgi:hypothetical protein